MKPETYLGFLLPRANALISFLVRAFRASGESCPKPANVDLRATFRRRHEYALCTVESPTLQLAARMRAGELPTSPAQLYLSAQQELSEDYGRLELYRHAMLHTGALESALGPFKKCPRCGERLGERGPSIGPDPSRTES